MTTRRRAGFALAALVMTACLVALGIWQVERRAWKHGLIATVEANIHAAPIAAPGPDGWAGINPARDAYRQIRATGHFRHDREVLVQAVTERGGGFWVVTPLETSGFTVLVNRGFVPPERRDPASRAQGNPDGPVTITGLLRISEPGGGFLRSNDPAAGRWYSRDVAAIARAQGIADVAPYFIDADATANPGGYPVGGLTVVQFSDNHLVYALTWFGLALLTLYFAWRLWRPEPGGRTTTGE
ncbi:SURF1 family protein [Altererythrobacter xixiisoli]|uniref:SURF1-like protein n=1 Tax=Croceibacterium xixiisoli TaxID=1476466 RepID=A0A6I4TWV0_9SPHN|nr:SURF1 family protein [Croceibacterium xixiisoli]MXP00646.1 SURF1 family protein [Croceibacterium xixiisoli]